jgi:Flp pilus assembly protein TadB
MQRRSITRADGDPTTRRQRPLRRPPASPRRYSRFSAVAAIVGVPFGLSSWLGASIVGFVMMTVLGGVVLPAVWSRRPDRRRAALHVLDRLLPGSRADRRDRR